MASTRSYRGVPAAERHEQRRIALIETALDCLHADGLAGVSVRSICSRARLTPRYFYENFADLDELLLATVDAVTDEVAAAALSAAVGAGQDNAARARAAIDAGYGVVVTDPRKANALLVAAAGHGQLRERRHQIVTRYADLIIDSLPALSSLASAKRGDARATALFLMGGAAEVVEAVLAGRVRMSRARVTDHLTAMWMGALGLEPAETE